MAGKNNDRWQNKQTCLMCDACTVVLGGRWCQIKHLWVGKWEGRECRSYRVEGRVIEKHRRARAVA